MLPSLGFKGTTEVINKGVDITLLTDPTHAEDVFTLTRYLVVCGYSTAVLSVTELDPVDMKTINYYEKTTPLLVFLEESVGEAVIPQLDSETRYLRQYDCTHDELILNIPRWIREYKK